MVGSPRKGMNTDALVESALAGARSVGARTEKIYLDDLEVRPCRACRESPAPRYCLYEDGMETVYRAVDAADALVIGTPAYYGSISAQLKLVIDRSNCMSEMLTLTEGTPEFRSRVAKRKRGLFIWVADSSTDPGHALATVRLWCGDANVELVESMIVTGSERGAGARKREDLLNRAFDLGASIASTSKSGGDERVRRPRGGG